MTFFLGNSGNIRIRRGVGQFTGTFSDQVTPDDVSTNLNRFGLSKAIDNLITGDRIEIETTDSRGLEFIDPINWASGVIEKQISGYVNVNQVGGVRLFKSFQDAINNNRTNEYPLDLFSGAAIPVTISVRDTSYNVLGCVSNYELNTAREAIDTTMLSDKFKSQYAAGLISGSGRLECAFNYKDNGNKETALFVLQTIQRVDIGSSFDVALYVIDNESNPPEPSIYYEFEAVITSAGVTIDANNIISTNIEFLSTGEIKLLVGRPAGYVLKEDDDRVTLEQSLDFLLQEADD